MLIDLDVEKSKFHVMADKIVKAFEALRSHYLQESKEQPTASDVSDSPGPSNKYFILLFNKIYMKKEARVQLCW